MGERIYATTAHNTGGTHGTVSLSDGPSVTTGPPQHPEAGTNPEQFLAMSWATCLSASVEVALGRLGIDAAAHPPQVSVEVALLSRDGEYAFEPRARVDIPGLDAQRTLEAARAGHARCPVSKLLRGQGTPVVEAAGQAI
ncbi:OsmC family protein [Brevibacterium sp. BRM-1]|uniref:OsmC family protein n=1 Tax=Brevibacterium sp. BRM-1 TaxID=2999062 RepID=UPI0022832A6D|nr:OsmC family protein [Brevibacterium sp. BRM-1]WAL40709.1 OsmC family protein [Brevibacterium sp. BRM-1]